MSNLESKSDQAPFVVIGAGQAGLQICDSLRKGGFDGRLVLIGEEPELPYQRPPLSKKFLGGELEEARLAFRPAAFYEKNDIEIVTGTVARSLERDGRTVVLEDGTRVAYERLALATGARIRPLPCPGAEDERVHYVRTLADSRGLAAALADAAHLTVVGGGFIGLEVAAVARGMGKDVVVLEALDRLMARAVSPRVSAFYADLHRGHGVDIRLDTGVDTLEPTGRRLGVLAGGAHFETDLVVAGIGVLPNVELASEAGLICRNGIVVDAAARTSDPAIVAAGDCTMHYNGFLEREIRLESVQNAVDQAKIAAASMLGETAEYVQVPWFWSDQYDVKLQMAGIGMPFEEAVVRGDMSAAAFSVFYFRDGRLAGADSINSPLDHMACRKLLAQGTLVSADQLADKNTELMKLARA